MYTEFKNNYIISKTFFCVEMLRFFIPYYESFSVKQEEEKKLIFSLLSLEKKKSPSLVIKKDEKK